MKTLIIYGSHHHGSTEKLVKAIAKEYPVDLADAQKEAGASMENYDLIGFASGIDFGKFYPAVTDLAKALPEGKQVFALFTCARDNGRYGNEIREIAAQRGCTCLGTFGCKGYNTYGPWKIIGGMNKGHPSQEEKENAVQFYRAILCRVQEHI